MRKPQITNALPLRAIIQLAKLFVLLFQHAVFLNGVGVLLIRGSLVMSRVAILMAVASQCNASFFGEVSFGLAAVEIGKVIADLGVDAWGMRQFASTDDKRLLATAASKILFFKIMFIPLAYSTSILIFWCGTFDSFIVGVILSSSLMTTTLLNLPLTYYQARAKMLPPLIVICPLSAIATLLAVQLSNAHQSEVVLLAIIPVFEFIACFSLFLMLHFELRGDFVLKNYCQQIGGVLRNTWPIALTVFIVLVYSRLDVMLLRGWVNDQALGYYGFANRIVEPLQMIAAGFGVSLFGKVASLQSKGVIDEARKLLSRYSLAVVSLSSFVAITFAIGFDWIGALCFPDFVDSKLCVQLLLVATVFRCVNLGLSNVCYALGSYIPILLIAVWNLFFVSILLALLVPYFSIAGAAISIILVESLNTLIQFRVASWLLSLAKAKEVSPEEIALGKE